MLALRLDAAMSLANKSAVELHHIANNIPPAFRDDIINMLIENRVKTHADVKVYAALLKSATALLALPSYKALTGSDTVPKYCARCHAALIDKCNAEGACVIPHAFVRGGRGRRNEAVCHYPKFCGLSVSVEEDCTASGKFLDAERLQNC